MANILNWIMSKAGYVKAETKASDPFIGLGDSLALNGLNPFSSSVTQNNVMEQNASAYKALIAITSMAGYIKIKFVDRKTKTPVESPDIQEFFENPNPYMSGSDLIEFLLGFSFLFNEFTAFMEIETIGQAAGTKLPNAIYPFNPSLVAPKIDPQTQRPVAWIIGNKEYPLEQVVFKRNFNPQPNNWRGINPLSSLAKQFDVDWKSLVYSNAVYDNNGTPAFFLSTEKFIDENDVKQIETQFQKKRQGANKANTMAVLGKDLKPVFAPNRPDDMNMVEQRRHIREDILSQWRVPKSLFSMTEDLNYATFIGQQRGFAEYTLFPMIKKIAAGLNKDLVWRVDNRLSLILDISEMPAYQERFKESVATAKDLFSMNVNFNEINERLNLGFENKPERDTVLVPFSMIPLTEAVSSTADNKTDDTKQDKKTYFEKQNKKVEKNYAVLANRILRKHKKLEKPFKKKVGKFFLDQRKMFLNQIDTFVNDKSFKKGVEDFLFINWIEENERLIKELSPFILEGIKEGVLTGKELLENEAVNIDNLEQSIKRTYNVRMDNITGINKTTRETLIPKLQETFIKSTSEGLSITELATALKQTTKDYYNEVSDWRSLLIARTETTTSLNGGSFTYYREAGADYKRWQTAGDKEVRASHFEAQRQGAIPITDSFINGLEFPGDQKGDAGEIANCRCVLLPVFKGD